MVKKRLLLISLVTILIIFVLHYFAFKYSWYWNLRWFHIMMHLLGGFWITITAFWVSVRFNHIDTIVRYKERAFVIMVISVFIIGISWEAFELLSGMTSIHDFEYLNGFWDDLAGNFIGGIFGFFYFLKKKKCKLSMFCSLDSSAH
jgi:hypothetical protein